MCKVCKLWIHKSCSGLTAEVWAYYSKLSGMGHKDVITCNSCFAAWSKMKWGIVDTAAEVKQDEKRSMTKPKQMSEKR